MRAVEPVSKRVLRGAVLAALLFVPHIQAAWMQDVCATPNVLRSFNPREIRELNGIAVDPDTGDVLLHASGNASIHRYTADGTLLGTIAHPPNPGNDGDLDFTDRTITVNGMTIPERSLLVLRGESGTPTTAFFMDPNSGSEIASYDLAFSDPGHILGGTLHPLRDSFIGPEWGTDTVREYNLADGTEITRWSSDVDFYYGDLDVAHLTGWVYSVGSRADFLSVTTHFGVEIETFDLAALGVQEISGIALGDRDGTVWVCNTDGFVYQLNGLLPRDVASAVVSSSRPFEVAVMPGTLNEQIQAANTAPPLVGFASTGRRHVDFHQPASFACGDPNQDPNSQPYVSASNFLDGVDEVTLDNCSSAWYRFTFELPDNYINARLTGVANCDDLAVLWLNGHQISASIEAADVATGPIDRVDGDGRALFGWPTLDAFGAACDAQFVAGENELVFAVVGDASPFEPTGVEFQATLDFDLAGDLNFDCQIDLTDLAALLGDFGCATDCIGDADGNGSTDLGDLATVLAHFGDTCPQ